jgi:hypothetical protein
MTTTAETDHHAPKQPKALDERTIEKAKAKALEVFDEFSKLMPYEEKSAVKKCAILGCQMKREGTPTWEYNNWFYLEVIEQIKKI